MANLEKASRWDQFKSHFQVNRALLPLKAVMFLYYGGTTIFLPYITLHMVQIGITIEEVAIIYAVLPFASCLGPPTAGMIADKIGNYKAVLMSSIILMGLFHTLLTTIDAHGYPVGTNTTDPSLVFLTCDQSGQTFLQWPSCSNGSCPYEAFDSEPIIRLTGTDCFQTCEGGDLCLPEDSGCRPLDENVFLQLKLSFPNYSQDPENVCSMPVYQLTVANTTDTASLICQCRMECPALLVNQQIGCPEYEPPEFDHAKHNRGFWLYLVLRILGTAALGTSFTMLDASTICLIKKHKGELGKQRLCGVIGSAIFAMLSGVVIDWLSNSEADRDFSVTFYFADILLILVCFFLFFLDVSADKSEGKFVKNVFKLIRLVHVDIFMLMMLLLGTCWGFLEAYLFIFLIELNASSYLLGFTVTLGSLVGLPFLYISDIIVKKIGRIVLLLIAFFIYCIRFVGYSFIENPWWSLPFEALEAVTIHLMGVSMSLFCASAAPTGLLATLHGLAGSVHYSIGRGVGSFVGGYLIATYGTRVTFRIIGTNAGVCGIIFIILYHCFMRPFEEASARRQSAIETTRDREVAFHPLNISEDAEDSNTKKSFLSVPTDDSLSRRLSF